MSRKGKQKTKRKRIIAKNERYRRDIWEKILKNNKGREMSSKKYAKCSICGKNLSDPLRYFFETKDVCEKCFLNSAGKVKKQ
ncbi:hypothetical protein ES703_98824 [subsurface metagenome]